MSRRAGFRVLQVVAAVGVAALGGVLVWNLAHQHTGAAKKIVAGKVTAAPPFDLRRLDGAGRLSLASLRGKVVVLNFWASDCLPCKQEMPRVEAAAKRYDGRVVFVGVDVDDGDGPARAFMKRYGATYANVADPIAETAGDFGVIGTPTTMFVDRRGRVVPPRVQGVVTATSLADGIRRAEAA